MTDERTYVLMDMELKKVKHENTELKQLLKLAVEDMQHMSCVENICDVCIDDPQICAIYDTCRFTWGHYNEVKGLIKDGNEMDTLQ